jgi:hypothetical protein
MNSPSECNDALRMRKIGDASSAFSQRDKGGKLQAMRRIRRFGNGEFLEQCEEHDSVMGADSASASGSLVGRPFLVPAATHASAGSCRYSKVAE